MAVYSMTGYANAASDPAGVSAEARSVNGRFLDLALRLPDELRGLEPALRDLLTGSFKRGKIELRLSTTRDGDTAWPAPSPDQLNRLAHLQNGVQSWLPQARALSVNEVMQWCRTATPADKLDEPALETGRTGAGRRQAMHPGPARGTRPRGRTPDHHAAGPRSTAARTGSPGRPAAARGGATAAGAAGPRHWPGLRLPDSTRSPVWPIGPRNVRWAKRQPLPSASTSPKNSHAWVPTWTRSKGC